MLGHRNSENFQDFPSGVHIGSSPHQLNPELHFQRTKRQCTVTIGHRNYILNVKKEVRQSAWINPWYVLGFCNIFRKIAVYMIITVYVIFFLFL